MEHEKRGEAASLVFSLEDDGDDDYARQDNDGAKDPYQHVASVLTNVTQIEAGRRFVTSMSSTLNGDAVKGGSILPPLFKALLLELRTSPNPVRRRGCAGTVKNCCFESDLAKLWMLPLLNNPNLNSEDDMLLSLLIPLVGPEEISDEDEKLMMGDILLSHADVDKVRERDAETRLLIIETILLLCAAGRRVREILRARGTYIVLKNADMVEDRQDISEQIEECVQFLRRDEQGTHEGSSDQAAIDIAKKIKQNMRNKIEDYDDVD